jgi:uncharacterized protein
VRFELHVRPNSSRTVVGGTHDGVLVVRVTSPAQGGMATRAALAAVAKALGVSHDSVTLVRGPNNRRKLVEIAESKAQEELLERLSFRPSHRTTKRPRLCTAPAVAGGNRYGSSSTVS